MGSETRRWELMGSSGLYLCSRDTRQPPWVSGLSAKMGFPEGLRGWKAWMCLAWQEAEGSCDSHTCLWVSGPDLYCTANGFWLAWCLCLSKFLRQDVSVVREGPAGFSSWRWWAIPRRSGEWWLYFPFSRGTGEESSWGRKWMQTWAKYSELEWYKGKVGKLPMPAPFCWAASISCLCQVASLGPNLMACESPVAPIGNPCQSNQELCTYVHI